MKKPVTRGLFLLSVLLIAGAPAMAQYTDGLGGNWNNPASAMITNMIMDRYARRRLEKSYADKRAKTASAGSRTSAASELPPKVDDASLRFRSTGTQLKTREIANLIGPGNEQVFAVLTTILQEFGNEAQKIGKPNDLPLALSFFFATNASIYHDGGVPPDPKMLELRDVIAGALIEDNAFSGVSDRQKQEMYEALVLYTGLAL